jgi:hypothetical protein
VSRTYRAGETIIFKYEGNVRATVEGCELLDVKLRWRCRAEICFLVRTCVDTRAPGRL